MTTPVVTKGAEVNALISEGNEPAVYGLMYMLHKLISVRAKGRVCQNHTYRAKTSVPPSSRVTQNWCLLIPGQSFIICTDPQQ